MKMMLRRNKTTSVVYGASTLKVFQAVAARKEIYRQTYASFVPVAFNTMFLLFLISESSCHSNVTMTKTVTMAVDKQQFVVKHSQFFDKTGCFIHQWTYLGLCWRLMNHGRAWYVSRHTIIVKPKSKE